MNFNALADTALMQADKPESGFFSDYSLLKPVNGPKDTKVFRYTSTKFDPSNYKSIIIDSVLINQSSVDDKITNDIIEKTRLTLEENIKQKVTQFLALTQTPGAQTLKVNISISGADLATEGFKVRNLLPISAVLKLASKATNKDKKTAVLLIESKVTDSQTGELLKGTMVTISSESFRDNDEAGQEFENLAKKVVELAMAHISTQ
ncbi:MAG: DUF3313 domain-containing protein [Sulfuritalea sp.]|nr:DUF3313 domain-containing protein [Sulfuritalea sp.]